MMFCKISQRHWGANGPYVLLLFQITNITSRGTAATAAVARFFTWHAWFSTSDGYDTAVKIALSWAILERASQLTYLWLTVSCRAHKRPFCQGLSAWWAYFMGTSEGLEAGRSERGGSFRPLQSETLQQDLLHQRSLLFYGTGQVTGGISRPVPPTKAKQNWLLVSHPEFIMNLGWEGAFLFYFILWILLC